MAQASHKDSLFRDPDAEEMAHHATCTPEEPMETGQVSHVAEKLQAPHVVQHIHLPEFQA